MRITSIFCLLIAVVQLHALETPLVMQQFEGVSVAFVNPRNGAIQVYQSGGTQLKAVERANFLTDLHFLSNAPHPRVVTYQRLRAGSDGSVRGMVPAKPTYNDMLDMLPNKSKVDGAASLRSMAVRGENTFWETYPQYDGVIRGVFTKNYLVLCAPALRCLLAYKYQNNKLEFYSYRNLGPDLYLPQGYNTKPSPEEIFRQLPNDIRDAYQEQLDEEMQGNLENPNAEITLQEFDPWIANLGQDRIVFLEPNNRFICMYEMRQKELFLHSARNLKYDLMIPSDVNFQSLPTVTEGYRDYTKAMRRARKTPLSSDELIALEQTTPLRVDGDNADEPGLQAEVDSRQGKVYLDFTGLNMTLLFNGGRGVQHLELLAARNYSLDLGIALHLEEVNRTTRGSNIYKAAVKMASDVPRDGSYTATLRTMRLALEFNPALIEEAEGERKLKKMIEKNPEEWQEISEMAQKQLEVIRAAEEKRKELLEAQR